MKTLLLTTLIALSTSLTANASYMYETCTNADATIETKSGHVIPSVIVYMQLATTDYQGTKEPIKLERDSIDIVELDEKKISSKTTRGCAPGESFGYMSSTSIYSKKVTISNKDGSNFPYGVFNLSTDRLTISDYVICESHISSRIFCD